MPLYALSSNTDGRNTLHTIDPVTRTDTFVGNFPIRYRDSNRNDRSVGTLQNIISIGDKLYILPSRAGGLRELIISTNTVSISRDVTGGDFTGQLRRVPNGIVVLGTNVYFAFGNEIFAINTALTSGYSLIGRTGTLTGYKLFTYDNVLYALSNNVTVHKIDPTTIDNGVIATERIGDLSVSIAGLVQHDGVLYGVTATNRLYQITISASSADSALLDTLTGNARSIRDLTSDDPGSVTPPRVEITSQRLHDIRASGDPVVEPPGSVQVQFGLDHSIRAPEVNLFVQLTVISTEFDLGTRNILILGRFRNELKLINGGVEIFSFEVGGDRNPFSMGIRGNRLYLYTLGLDATPIIQVYSWNLTASSIEVIRLPEEDIPIRNVSLGLDVQTSNRNQFGEFVVRRDIGQETRMHLLNNRIYLVNTIQRHLFPEGIRYQVSVYDYNGGFHPEESVNVEFPPDYLESFIYRDRIYLFNIQSESSPGVSFSTVRVYDLSGNRLTNEEFRTFYRRGGRVFIDRGFIYELFNIDSGGQPSDLNFPDGTYLSAIPLGENFDIRTNPRRFLTGLRSSTTINDFAKLPDDVKILLSKNHQIRSTAILKVPTDGDVQVTFDQSHSIRAEGDPLLLHGHMAVFDHTPDQAIMHVYDTTGRRIEDRSFPVDPLGLSVPVHPSPPSARQTIGRIDGAALSGDRIYLIVRERSSDRPSEFRTEIFVIGLNGERYIEEEEVFTAAIENSLLAPGLAATDTRLYFVQRDSDSDVFRILVHNTAGVRIESEDFNLVGSPASELHGLTTTQNRLVALRSFNSNVTNGRIEFYEFSGFLRESEGFELPDEDETGLTFFRGVTAIDDRLYVLTGVPTGATSRIRVYGVDGTRYADEDFTLELSGILPAAITRVPRYDENVVIEFGKQHQIRAGGALDFIELSEFDVRVLNISKNHQIRGSVASVESEPVDLRIEFSKFHRIRADGDVTIASREGDIRITFRSSHRIRGGGDIRTTLPVEVRVTFDPNYSIRGGGNLGSPDKLVEFVSFHQLRGGGDIIVNRTEDNRVIFGLNHGIRASSTLRIKLPPIAGVGLEVYINGQLYPFARKRVRVKRPSDSPSRAKIHGLIRANTLARLRPSSDQEVQIYDRTLRRLVFGGYLYEPDTEIKSGNQLVEITFNCLGYTYRLQKTDISQEQGINVIKQTTVLAQMEALVNIMGDEGFRVGIAPSGGTTLTSDIRFTDVYSALEQLASLNSSNVVVEQNKIVSIVNADNIPDSRVVLNERNVMSIKSSVDRQSYRSFQRMIGGFVTRSELLSGDGGSRAFRIGGMGAADSTSYFGASAPVGPLSPVNDLGLRSQFRGELERIDIFDELVSPGWSDPAFPQAAPGLAWKTTQVVPERGLLDESTIFNFPIPPRYVESNVRAYIASIEISFSRVNISLTGLVTSDDADEEIQFSLLGINNLTLIVSTESGDSLSWKISDLISDGDTNPYSWGLPNNISTQFITDLAPQGAKVALVDTTIEGVDVDAVSVYTDSPEINMLANPEVFLPYYDDADLKRVLDLRLYNGKLRVLLDNNLTRRTELTALIQHVNSEQSWAAEVTQVQNIPLFDADGLSGFGDDVYATQGLAWKTKREGIDASPNPALSFITNSAYGFISTEPFPSAYIRDGADTPRAFVSELLFDAKNNRVSVTLSDRHTGDVQNSLYLLAENQLWVIDPLNPFLTLGVFGLRGNLPTSLDKPNGLFSHRGSLYCIDITNKSLWRINSLDPSDTSGQFGRVGLLPSFVELNPEWNASIIFEDELYLVGSENRVYKIDITDPDNDDDGFGLIGAFPYDPDPIDPPQIIDLTIHNGVMLGISSGFLWIVDLNGTSLVLVSRLPTAFIPFPGSSTGYTEIFNTYYSISSINGEIYLTDEQGGVWRLGLLNPGNPPGEMHKADIDSDEAGQIAMLPTPLQLRGNYLDPRIPVIPSPVRSMISYTEASVDDVNLFSIDRLPFPGAPHILIDWGLYRLDPDNSGDTTNFGPISGPFYFQDDIPFVAQFFGMENADGELYVFLLTRQGFYRVFVVDPNNPHDADRGRLVGNISALIIEPSNPTTFHDIWYIVDKSTNILYSAPIDNPAAATEVKTLGAGVPDMVALTILEGRLYGVSNPLDSTSDAQLWVIDPTNAGVTEVFVGNLPPEIRDILSLTTFRGDMWLSSSDSLWIIDHNDPDNVQGKFGRVSGSRGRIISSFVGSRNRPIQLTEHALSNLHLAVKTLDNSEYIWSIDTLSSIDRTNRFNWYSRDIDQVLIDKLRAGTAEAMFLDGSDSNVLLSVRRFRSPIGRNGILFDLGVGDTGFRERALENQLFVTAIVDSSLGVVDIPNREFISQIDNITVDRVTAVRLNAADQIIGPGEWSFNIATQEIIPPAYLRLLRLTDLIEVTEEGRWIVEESSGVSPSVHDTEYVNLPLVEQGRSLSRARLRQHRNPSESLMITIFPNARVHIDDGEGVRIDTSLTGSLGTLNPDQDEIYITDYLEINTEGDILVYTVRVSRRVFESKLRPFWNRLLGSRR